VHISASRDNEVSFDDELKGGLATQFMRDCMLRDAKDLDGSGALSVDEIRQCAQEKVEKRMQNDPQLQAASPDLEWQQCVCAHLVQFARYGCCGHCAGALACRAADSGRCRYCRDATGSRAACAGARGSCAS
jgi:hypothetical protein